MSPSITRATLYVGPSPAGVAVGAATASTDASTATTMSLGQTGVTVPNRLGVEAESRAAGPSRFAGLSAARCLSRRDEETSIQGRKAVPVAARAMSLSPRRRLTQTQQPPAGSGFGNVRSG